MRRVLVNRRYWVGDGDYHNDDGDADTADHDDALMTTIIVIMRVMMRRVRGQYGPPTPAWRDGRASAWPSPGAATR
eukprot:335277-Pyramimonas_sp.AAC.1